MGIDPGLAATGWGIIRRDGEVSHYLASGVIHTSPASEHVARLAHIYGRLTEVARQWQPQIACVERVFANLNGKTSMALGEARGAAVAALIACDLPVMEISALQIKKAITGMGRADKKQVGAMVSRLLSISTDGFRTDATDALACALTFTPLQAMHSRLPSPRSRRRRAAPR